MDTSFAASLSPSARMMAALLSCSAFATTNFDLSASCWAASTHALLGCLLNTTHDTRSQTGTRWSDPQ